MKTWHKLVLVLILILVAGGYGVYRFVINKPHPDIENMKADYSVDAATFYKEFKTSKDNALKLYNGKVIELAGKLNRVETVDTLTIAVFIFNQGLFGDEGIRCTMLRKYAKDTQKLKPDGIVRIKGYCTGATDSDVILEKCSLIIN
jgi:hypothetical protein